MNSKKKIIETLKKADKASVERLMEEQTRKEAVFARVQRKAADHNEYTDVAEGVEKYERKINMTRIISAAAAMVVVLGAIGGGAYLRRNKGPKTPEDVLTAPTTTAVSATAAVTTIPANVTTGKNISTVTVTAANGSATTAAEVSATTATTAAVTKKAAEKPAVTTAPQSSSTNTEEKVLAELREYSQFGEETEKIYKEYARIIDECSTMIKGGDMTGAKYDPDLSREFISASHEDPAHIGYAFYDIDEDGVKELLLGVNYNYGEESRYFDSVIYNIFGADSNGEVKCVVNGALRDRYYICTNPTADRPMNGGMQHGSFIMNAGSGGASNSVNYFYRLAYDKLRYVEGVVTDGIDDNNEPITYYSATKEYDTSDEARISNDEANKIIDSYNIVDFRFTALD
ncbi:hypothetical protein [Ruminococcus flavefaciens]|uniref:Uncharacterized protein n=1 Tax=Ruminococcus flavefaciens TaxID=1265 RepID=A0A315Y0B6_RUMFL|nr:hypothetical protein [Ruminococcus flavefaciens]PWJ13595.1 hypothetical protein IE37_01403 [Ruminococcus flavefaciens]SSA48163.1 hypothetical protein SAMN02910325_01403 [Ruminococcus flavefaciens]